MTQPFTLPEPRTAPLRINPSSALFYGPLKCGKTSAVAAIPDLTLLELQPGGADFVPHGRVIEVKSCEELLAVLDHLTKAYAEGKPLARRIGIDHLGLLDEWIQKMALDNYCKFPMKVKDAASYKRVTDIPGFGEKSGSPGWSWLWAAQEEMYRKIVNAAPEVIFIAHVRTKYIATEKNETAADDVDIDGKKARMLFCGNTSAIGRFYRKIEQSEDRLYVTFKTSEATCGCAIPRLSGTEHVIGRRPMGSKELPVFDWSQIYLPESL